MKVSLIIFSLMLLALVPAVMAQTTDVNDLEGTEWQLMSYGPANAQTEVVPESDVTINFLTNNQVEGNGGCNQYSGSYARQGAMLDFNDVVTTLMACVDDAITQQEQTYFDALNRAARYERSGSQLIIWYGENGQQQLNYVFVGQEADILEGSSWEFETYGPPNAQTGVIVGSNITINFLTNNQVEGHGGCNGYSGAYQTAGTGITFSDIIHTELACADPDMTTQEQDFFAALESATRYQGFFNSLVITYPGGELNFAIIANDSESRTCTNPWVVQSGDTLIEIALACNTTLPNLLAANLQITNPALIYRGQEITIPQSDVSAGQIAVEQASASPGSIINVTGTGFAPHVDLDIGFGLVNSEFQIIGAARTTTDGSFRTTVAIPDYADPDTQWVFGAIAPDGYTAVSAIFDVTSS